MDRWNDKVALVTGASVGIGAAIARDLVKAGMKVIGLALRVERMAAIADELKSEKGIFYPMKCDVKNEENVKKVFRSIKVFLGGVDVLINNAGLFKPGLLSEEGNSSLLRSVLDTNIWALCICTREAVLSMQERNVDGHIIHINSINGHNVPNQLALKTYANAYPACKYAVTALTETLRQELIDQDSKIKVTSISPGAVHTSTLSQELSPDFPMLQPADISQAVLYVLGTPPHVQVQELIIKPVGENYP